MELLTLIKSLSLSLSFIVLSLREKNDTDVVKLSKTCKESD